MARECCVFVRSFVHLHVAACQMHCVWSFVMWPSVIVTVMKFCCPFKRQEQTFFQNIENFSSCQRGVCPEYSILCLSIVTNLNVIYFSVSTPISNKQTRTEVRYISCEQQSHVLYIGYLMSNYQH